MGVSVQTGLQDPQSPQDIDRQSQPEQVNQQDLQRTFLEPFADLLAQVEMARAAEIYALYPRLRSLAEIGNGVEDATQIVLVANDYLGLSQDPRVREAAQQAVAEFGTSRCASPLAGGSTRLYVALEDHLKSFLQQQGVAVFASGYQANVGVISALMQPGDLILTDLFNHASIVDGARLSGADIRVFQHNRHTHLESLLKRDRQSRRVLVIVEGVYSADGDIVKLPEIVEVAHRYGAVVMIDEAHSFGVLGRDGRGAAEHFDMLHDVDVIMGTMSKSLASVGGFIVGNQRIIDVVRHNARSLIFSAAPPPASVAAADRALHIIETEPARRERLWDNARFFIDGLESRGFELLGSETPVIPLLVGDQVRTMELTVRLPRDPADGAGAPQPDSRPRHCRSRSRIAHPCARHHRRGRRVLRVASRQILGVDFAADAAAVGCTGVTESDGSADSRSAGSDCCGRAFLG
jgi:8-amino-7-oxononanoate synthase